MIPLSLSTAPHRSKYSRVSEFLSPLLSFLDCLRHFLSSSSIIVLQGEDGEDSEHGFSKVQVRVGQLIAEGGFGSVLEGFAIHSPSGRQPQYAIKQIRLTSLEVRQRCHHEVAVHRAVRRMRIKGGRGHANLMGLEGFAMRDKSSSDTWRKRIWSSLRSDSYSHYNQSDSSSEIAYLLFPFIPHSLRGEIHERNLLGHGSLSSSQHLWQHQRHFSTRQALDIFGGILDALVAMHSTLQLSHRDVKLDNILLQRNQRPRLAKTLPSAHSPKQLQHSESTINTIVQNNGRSNGKSEEFISFVPILTDYGSSGALLTHLTSKLQLHLLIEEAATDTTCSYRPPELWEGGFDLVGARSTDNTRSNFHFRGNTHDQHSQNEWNYSISSTNNANSYIGHKNKYNIKKDGSDGNEMKTVEAAAVLDYGKVDVWSLGCVLFGIMHGCSPFEMEFVRDLYNIDSFVDDENEDVDDRGGNCVRVRTVECTQLKVLGEMPYPPWLFSTGVTATTATNKDKMIHHQRHSEKQPDGRKGRYPLAMYDFIQFMTVNDRMKRPAIDDVSERFSQLYWKLLGEKWSGCHEDVTECHGELQIWNQSRDDVCDDFDSLIAGRNNV